MRPANRVTDKFPFTHKQFCLLDALYLLLQDGSEWFGPTEIARNACGFCRQWRGERKLTSSWASPTLLGLVDRGIILRNDNGQYTLSPPIRTVIAAYRD